MLKAPIRVLIADGDPLVREDLRSVLGQRSDIQIVSEAAESGEIIEKVIQLDPDIILLDQMLRRRGGGLTILRLIKARAPRSKVILFASPESKSDFVEAIRLGCSGVVLKGAPTNLVARSIRRAHAGEIWIDSITAAVIHQFAFSNSIRSNTRESRTEVQLSRRERELIFLIGHGLRNKEIAKKLLISVQSVKNHLHRVFEKLGVSDRLELALYAVHNPSSTLNPELHLEKRRRIQRHIRRLLADTGDTPARTPLITSVAKAE